MRKMRCSWCTAGERTTKGETCATPDDWTLFRRTKMVCNPCDLGQARAMRSALVNRLYCTDVCCEWVSCLHVEG